MKKLIAVIIFSMLFFSCSKEDNQMNYNVENFQKFATVFETKAEILERNMAEAYFKAAQNGTSENWEKFSKAEVALNMHFGDSVTYSEVEKFRNSDLIKDPFIKRHIDILYFDLRSKQMDKDILQKISDLQSKIEQKYTEFRAVVDGNKFDDNNIEDILKTSKNNEELRNIWEAHKLIGPIVKNDIIELIKLRNQAAKDLGYDNYHTMSLILSEQDPEEISELFDELDVLTKDAFINIKDEIDDYLAARLKIEKNELMPWHYQNRYFQEAPSIFNLDMDNYFEDKDIVDITTKYFAGINMPIESMVQKSDLYPRENKNQHAFCINIDRDAKDVRVLCNIAPNFSWMETMMHEYGHAVYENYYDDELPWSMKEPAHIFTTEAIAMLFGRMASDPQWLQDNVQIDDKEKEDIKKITKKILSYQQLVFSRWAQVMYRFEKEMYNNPDQDLDALWWNIVEEYQMIKKPQGRNMPDWATKIHIATAPAYYHNYLLGELLASQLYFKITENTPKVDGEFVVLSKNEYIGNYLKDNIFAVGRKYHWSEMIAKATGEELTAKYYARQFIN